MAALETGMAPRLGGACEPFRPRPSRCALAYDESWNSLTVWSLFTIAWLTDSLYKRVIYRSRVALFLTFLACATLVVFCNSLRSFVQFVVHHCAGRWML